MPSSRSPFEDFVDSVHHHGREAQGGLVQQDEPGARHQRAGDDQLLLLAAGELAAGSGKAPAQEGEALQHALEVRPHLLAVAPHLAAQQDVLLHRELGEDVAPLRHHGKA